MTLIVIQSQVNSLKIQIEKFGLKGTYVEYLDGLNRFNIYNRNSKNVKQVLVSGSFDTCMGWLHGFNAGVDFSINVVKKFADAE